MVDSPGRDAVDDELRQARQAFSDAVGARESGLSDTVVVNRLYYACFHAAQAVLYERGLHPESHGAVLSLFGSEVVGNGDAPRAHGRLLNDLSTLRKQADYAYGAVETDVDSRIDDVQEFVSSMEDLTVE